MIVGLASQGVYLLFFVVGGRQLQILVSPVTEAVIQLANIVFPLSMLPIAVVLHRFHGEDARILGPVTMVIGIAGMLAAPSLWTLRTSNLLTIGFRLSIQLSATIFVAIGVWVLISGVLIRAHGGNWGLPNRLARLGVVAGSAMVLSFSSQAVAHMLDEAPQFWDLRDQLFMVVGPLGFFAWIITYPLWAIWLGRRLSART